MKYLTFILLFICSFKFYAQINIEEKQIETGIIHKKIINTEDTLIINILKIDLTGDNYILMAVKGGGKLNARETTSSMVRTLTDSGYNVIAAINADFFEADGEVINNMISEGNFVKAVKFTDSPYNEFVNTQFAVTYGNKLLMDQFVFTGYIILPNGCIEKIERINANPDSNSLSLYNCHQGNYIPERPDSWLTLDFVMTPVKKNNDEQKYIIKKIHLNKPTEISDNEVILSASNSYAKYMERELAVSDTITLLIRLNPYYSGIRSLIGGWPRIVADGENIIKKNNSVEGVFKGFSETKHPRTGIGFSRDSSTVFFITVDGRQELSRGISLEEFADLMISEGVYHGLNLDGGGSTTMVIKNKVINNPSDKTGERTVGNCLIVVKKK